MGRIERVRASARLGVVVFLASLLVEPSALHAQTREDAVGHVQPLRMHRTRAETRALEIKARFKPGTGEHEKALQLYTTAFEAFDAYGALLLTSIQAGTKLPKLDMQGAESVKANQAFCDYVDNLLKRPNDSLAWSKVVDGLVVGWEAIRKLQSSKRKQLAELIGPEIKWKRWPDVK